ncbi:MAG: RsmE family RNA methyltransferase [Bacilli bacterium]|nr:RsmE family RNA methyltransferase [Bacilli bacterium]
MQRYFARDKKNNELFLNEDDIRHIKLVMRMKDNDLIEVIFDDNLYICSIIGINENISFKIEKQVKQKFDEQVKVRLIVPVLKEQKMDYILQKSTELGVFEIVPVLTERTLVKLDEKDAVKKVDRWQKIVKEASEQSKRNTIPLVRNVTNLKDLKLENGLCLFCSTVEKENNIKKIFSNLINCDTINIVVGPEGGLSINEEELLKNKGYESVSLGKRILRVETAPLFVLSVINYIYME